LIFVLSASDSDVSTMNLANPTTLRFNGYSAGEMHMFFGFVLNLHYQLCQDSTDTSVLQCHV